MDVVGTSRYVLITNMFVPGTLVRMNSFAVCHDGRLADNNQLGMILAAPPRGELFYYLVLFGDDIVLKMRKDLVSIED